MSLLTEALVIISDPCNHCDVMRGNNSIRWMLLYSNVKQNITCLHSAHVLSSKSPEDSTPQFTQLISSIRNGRLQHRGGALAVWRCGWPLSVMWLQLLSWRLQWILWYMLVTSSLQVKLGCSVFQKLGWHHTSHESRDVIFILHGCHERRRWAKFFPCNSRAVTWIRKWVVNGWNINCGLTFPLTKRLGLGEGFSALHSTVNTRVLDPHHRGLLVLSDDLARLDIQREHDEQ